MKTSPKLWLKSYKGYITAFAITAISTAALLWGMPYIIKSTK